MGNLVRQMLDEIVLRGGKIMSDDEVERWEIKPALAKRMREIARQLRRTPTPSEATLWRVIRKQQLDGRKFRRQMAIGAFVVDFYCHSERLVIEVDGSIHDKQQEADKIRQELIEGLGIRFIRVKNDEIENNLNSVLDRIRSAFQAS